MDSFGHVGFSFGIRIDVNMIFRPSSNSCSIFVYKVSRILYNSSIIYIIINIPVGPRFEGMTTIFLLSLKVCKFISVLTLGSPLTNLVISSNPRPFLVLFHLVFFFFLFFRGINFSYLSFRYVNY